MPSMMHASSETLDFVQPSFYTIHPTTLERKKPQKTKNTPGCHTSEESAKELEFFVLIKLF